MRTPVAFLIALLMICGLRNGVAQPHVQRIPGGVVAGNARIRILTPTLVRLENSASGSFTDSLTAVVVNRQWPVPQVKMKEEGEWIILASGTMTVRYRPSPGPFTGDNLSVEWKDADHRWTPADSDAYNLGGITRSLDGARRGRLPEPTPGILSRSGYFLLDDSKSPLWDGSARWIVPRTAGQDWYLFVYGRDYRHVLKEYSQLCGKIPMIPKYALGSWVTDLNYEYLPGTAVVDDHRYTGDSVRSIIMRFRSEGIPLDVMVLDYAWHLRGWHGSYDWSPIFPNPPAFLSWARSEGIKVTLNDHPGYAKETVLSNQDSRAAQVRTALNIPVPPDPSMTISLLGAWKFRTDPAQLGDGEGWYAEAFDDARWGEIAGDRPWEDRGYPGYDGVAWYRQWVTIPADLHMATLMAVFGSVDDEYDLYVNGGKVAHHSPAWNTLTTTEILPYIRKGERNLIALRVNDWGGEGGLSGPTAMITDVVRQAGMRFNLAEKRQADVFMNMLHAPLIDQGVSFWWVDGGAGSSEMAGLNGQMWTNRVFYDYTGEQTGKRSLIFSRYGGWGSHRYPALFTGDTYAQWEVLACEVPYTAQGGNILMPYITHDIGGFIGKDISLDLYVRWLQFGVFSPLLRLHSAHENPIEGNARLPWTYGPEGVRLARDLFRLRYRLIPYIYTMTRVVHDEAIPIVRPLYLEHPGLEEAYRQPQEYYFGDAMLVAPILDSSGVRSVYLPPGEWVDYFSGSRYAGDRTMQVTCTLETLPLYVRAGSIIPQQPDMAYTDQRPLDSLIVDVYGPGRADFTLYEDDGISLLYPAQSARTPMSLEITGESGHRLSIGPTKGTYAGQPRRRAFLIGISGVQKPSLISLNGIRIASGNRGGDTWEWEAKHGRAVVRLGRKDIRGKLVITLR